MANDNELSIEETNKIRLSLGLKPLKVDVPASSTSSTDPYDEATTEGRERRAVDNWKAHTAELEKAASRKRRHDDIKKARDSAQRFRKLEGVGLADEEDDAGEDASSWVRKMKKRQKAKAEEIAKTMEEELQREASERKEYTAAELKGLKVKHDMADLGDMDGGTILTLKDSTIEENEEEGDELVSTDLVEQERLMERLDLKKKKPAYNVYEDEEEGVEKQLLAQYDDDEDKERKKKRFVLDGSGSLAGNETYRQEVAEKLKLKAMSLDLPTPEILSDYIDPASIKVRKPRKKSKSTRKRPSNDDDELKPTEPTQPVEAMELDDTAAPAAPKRRIAEDVSFVDDEDLQAQLALQRRSALKKRRIMKPADIARQFQEEALAVEKGLATPGGAMQVDDDEEAPGLVIDETSEFVATLRAPVVPERKVRAVSIPKKEESPEPEAEGEAEDGDINMIRDERASPKPEPEPETIAPQIFTSTGLEEETTISRGVGATLAMLNQRGLLKRDPEAEKRNELARQRDKFQAQKKLHEIEAEDKAKAARLKDRQSGKFERMSAREREEHARWENKQRDVQEAREMQQRFEDYKPDVNLSYKDEFGREMNQKEAFKFLSHQFHGKGSGKAKTEKRLKKIEDEKKREAASGLGSAADNAVSTAAKKSKQAGVRLM